MKTPKSPRLLSTALLVGAFLPMATAAPPPGRSLSSGDREGLHLTLYQDNRGLVRESYRFHHPAGRSLLRLDRVPAAMEPRSVQATFNEAGIRLLEQRHEHDLLTPRRLLETALGKPVVLVFSTADGGERRLPATLLSARDGIVVRAGDEILVNPEAQLVFPGLPAGVVPRPAVVWEIEAARPGDALLELSYITGGQNWSTDYVASLDADGRMLDLTVWVTVENNTEVPYENAGLALVAGEVHRAAPARGKLMAMESDAMMSRAVAGPAFTSEKAMDFHLYRLGRQVDLPAYSSRQFVLHQAMSVPVHRRHVVSAGSQFLQRRGPAGDPARLPVQSRLEFVNAGDHGLGLPLPAGIARVFQDQADGGRVFLGSDRLPGTADGETISLIMGNSFDLVAERTQTDYQQQPGAR
ncbi:MAG: hypothetical protein O7F11_05985, partial [Acidobacteria bacterium]|nr:hypothetical protein [Acidobacteriota bacterium]